MAIKINNLNFSTSSGKTFSDIQLDLNVSKKDGGKYKSKNVTESNDIVVDYDTSAIKNSVLNILTTQKGQRPLSLEFGINLHKFIGDPITPITANAIAAEIKRGIEIWEPRIELKKIYIYPNPDQLMYEIIIELDIPALDGRSLKLGGALSRDTGLVFV